MFDALKKYAVFSGRARRKEYWLFYLLFLLVYIFFAIIDASSGTLDPETGIGVLTGILFLAFLIPQLAVGVRRLHDTDRSGWWLLVGFIPLVGPILLIVFFCLDGSAGDNRFGENPKEEESSSAV